MIEPCLIGCRILVVEDDFFIRIDLESILRDAGAEVIGPCRGIADALELLTKSQVTAAILDMQLGHETVVPVARELTKRGTPFIFYSGQHGVDPALVEWSSHPILDKPALPRAIVGAVADLLPRHARDVRLSE